MGLLGGMGKCVCVHIYDLLDVLDQVDHKDELRGDPGANFWCFFFEIITFCALVAILGPSWGFLGRLGAAGPFSAMWASFSRKKVPVYCILRVIGAQGECCAGSSGSSGSASIHRKRNQRCGTDPGFPAPGARMTVVTQTPSNEGCFLTGWVPNSLVGLF